MHKNTKTALWVAMIPLSIAMLFMVKVINDSKGTQTFQEIHLYQEIKTLYDFQLTTAHSTVINKSALKGYLTLVFFGYTHCPDVCPTTMANLAKIYQKLKPDAQKKVKILFVSVDPSRDTPDKISEYAQYFNPKFQAATASIEVLTQFTQSMGALFMINKPDAQGNYEVDHTTKVFLLNEDVNLIGIFDGQLLPPAQEYPVDQLVNEMQRIVFN